MKKIILSLFSIIFVMLILPFLAITLVPSDAGFAVTLILFFIINPFFAAGLGVFSGYDIKKRWFLPIISPVIFLLSVWTLFATDSAFLIYASAYLVIGFIAMIITYLIRR